MELTEYKTLVFDCDGVVLDSNKVKTQAFYNAALPYGEYAAQSLVDYHVAKGGVSRYEKFAHFLDKIVLSGSRGPDLSALLAAYADEVRKGLLTCRVADGLGSLRDMTSHANWLIVSGGDQAELREIFKERGLADYFDGGIFGSPDNKDHILERELGSRNIQKPSLFLGDSKYDFQAARRADLDFIFVAGWSEWDGYASFENEFDARITGLKDMVGLTP
jgi:phosphoglycolate phosphatase-like HAD superfamily hydrolase